jgi:4-diphosphocytidyl-2C-methyl-D-erythritol kinase
MSGSGSTVFGIFFEEKEAKRAESALINYSIERNWKIFVAKALL